MVNPAQHVRPAPTVLAEELAAAVLVHQDNTLAVDLGRAHNVLLENTTVVPELAAVSVVQQTVTVV